MSRIFNWGIIGPGNIAHKFAQDLGTLRNAHLYAVASRSAERAGAFAGRHGAVHAFGSYQEMAGCPGLDAVYVASPHTGHCEHSLIFLEAGIPVLCEKPFAMNRREVAQMISAARRTGTFLMEAFWTRFLPTIQKTLDLIETGAIGEVLAIKADFGFRSEFDPKGRLYNKDLGGGALLDIGIYPAFLALLILGRPSRIAALAHFSSTGVDEEIGATLCYDNGQMAHLHASIRTRTKTEAFIYGTEGVIHLHPRWHGPTSMSLLRLNQRPEDFHFQYHNNGYAYEAEEVMRCLTAGKKESDLLPLSFSLDLITILDEIREVIGLQYAADGV